MTRPKRWKPSKMILAQALREARLLLSQNNVCDAGTEAEVILRHTLNCNRAELYLAMPDEISPRQRADYFRLIRRRAAHEPTAYITGHREFYGLEFSVDRRVLIPRPETEHLVEQALLAAKNYPASETTRIADAGTGSGAVAVTLAAHLPDAEIHATDISAEALGVARGNAERHGVAERIIFHHGDLLDGINGQLDIIVANLPYIDERGMGELPPEIALFEPVAALSGGSDGLRDIRRLCPAAFASLRPGGHLLLEIGENQAETLRKYLKELSPDAAVSVYRDLAGKDRVLKVVTPG
jgi:release factor glutamine methyltransferase